VFVVTVLTTGSKPNFSADLEMAFFAKFATPSCFYLIIADKKGEAPNGASPKYANTGKHG
jgi:hypothetical protein